MVRAVLSDGAHRGSANALPSETRRREDPLGADRNEGVVEAGGELGVADADEESHPPSGLFELATEVARDLGHRGAVGVGGDAEEVDDVSFDLDDEEHVVATEKGRVDGEAISRPVLSSGTTKVGANGVGTEDTWSSIESAFRTLRVLTLFAERVLPALDQEAPSGLPGRRPGRLPDGQVPLIIRSRSRNFSTLPVPVLGSTSTSYISSGTLKRASEPSENERRSSTVGMLSPS